MLPFRSVLQLKKSVKLIIQHIVCCGKSLQHLHSSGVAPGSLTDVRFRSLFFIWSSPEEFDWQAWVSQCYMCGVVVNHCNFWVTIVCCQSQFWRGRKKPNQHWTFLRLEKQTLVERPIMSTDLELEAVMCNFSCRYTLQVDLRFWNLSFCPLHRVDMLNSTGLIRW